MAVSQLGTVCSVLMSLEFCATDGVSWPSESYLIWVTSPLPWFLSQFISWEPGGFRLSWIQTVKQVVGSESLGLSIHLCSKSQFHRWHLFSWYLYAFNEKHHIVFHRHVLLLSVNQNKIKLDNTENRNLKMPGWWRCLVMWMSLRLWTLWDETECLVSVQQ